MGFRTPKGHELGGTLLNPFFVFCYEVIYLAFTSHIRQLLVCAVGDGVPG